ncbi:hypothetical protein SAMN05421747_10193 [Parapedobacter composti]|uniref:Uncharacterized protein n=1 Tax=Parapedobacter composti TaxID=623281 RepID=A0A1I1DTS6_9SPHI|nr:hypothetical protein SAMN05421747_10193 [Parapedobacter composti]
MQSLFLVTIEGFVSRLVCSLSLIFLYLAEFTRLFCEDVY